MKLNALFSDGAVFQRRINIPVFGKTDPYSKVEITFNGTTCCGLSGIDGSFLIRMKPQEAGGPYTMTVRNARTGDEAVVSDILVGEVWLASGQSNMEFTLNNSPSQLEDFVKNEKEIDTLRMFTVPMHAPTAPENDIPPVDPAKLDYVPKRDDWTQNQPLWVKADKLSAMKMSAVALWFAKKLRDTLNVPVGILHSSWGGTIIEAWTSMEMLRRNPDIAAQVQEYEENLALGRRWANIIDDKTATADVQTPESVLFDKYCTPNPPDEGSKRGWADLDFNDSAWRDFTLPNSWKATNMAGNGVVWVRKAVIVPDAWAGKDIEIHLGGIDKHDATYFNGECIGHTGEGFATDVWDKLRCYGIPGRLVKAGRNIVAVRAYSFAYDGAFLGHADDYYLQLKGTEEKVLFSGACKFEVEADFHFEGFPRSGESMGPGLPNTFANLFDAMIRPLIPYAIRGAIWYQGESNAGSIASSKNYERMMVDMIRDWRFRWGQGDFPFIQTLLAGFTAECEYSGECTWAVLRDSQRKAMLATPNSGIASAIDVGDVSDIHPKDKRTVGTRMALWALENTYNVPDTAGTGPEVSTLTREGVRTLRLTFDHCADGLVAKDGVLKGFYAAGQNGAYLPAEAKIEGNTVVLTSAMDNAVSVRYAWSTNPTSVISLYNGAGLPAGTFEIRLSC